MEEAKRQIEEAGGIDSPLGRGIGDLFERLINGKRVTRKVVEEAISDAAAWVIANQAAGQGPFHPPPGWTPPPGWNPQQTQQQQQHRYKRAPIDPRELEIRRARARARQVLGFAPTEPIDEAAIKARQRELAKKHHPDRGGDLSKMQDVNAAADVLLQAV